MTMTEPEWGDYVPEVTLRDQQIDALGKIWHSLYECDKQVVILEAPTGIGKSIIQLALARWVAEKQLGNSFIVTPQRALQDQMRHWAKLRVMKGRGSYDCMIVHGGTAANAPCTIDSKIRENHPECGNTVCPYYNALTLATNSPTVVHNYMSLLSQSRLGGHFGPRSLLCLDEGHTAVHWIRSFLSCELEPDDLMSFTSLSPPRNHDLLLPWLRWLCIDLDDVPKGVSEGMRNALSSLMKYRSAFGALTRAELEDLHEKSGSNKSFESFAKNTLLTSGDIPWSTRWNEPSNWKKEGSWSIIPLRIAPMSDSLTGLGTKVLIVTATALNKKLMMAEMGLSSDNAEYIIINSAFPVKNRPITKTFVGSMSYKRRKATLPKVIRRLAEIANSHKAEPGIIHTVSHALAEQVVEELTDRLHRPVVQLPRGSARDATIRMFLSGGLGPAAILVGPSLMEGLDGAGNSCRWQALIKVPWPHMKDPVIERMMKNKTPKGRRWANEWYNWKTAQLTVQAFGRVVRSADDYGATYLLDSSFQKVINSGYIPNYVMKAIS
jgi:ATP-dependent DNA helicase DinG